MVFSSFEFLLYFLPVVLAVYYIVPFRLKNIVLFISSLIFYGYGVKDHPVYLGLFVLSIFINHQLAKGLSRVKKSGGRNFLLCIAMIFNFGQLFLFKYLDFFIDNINFAISHCNTDYVIPHVNLELPIGISFYTFQMTSYLIDVYRKDVKREASLINFGTYVSMFPQLIAGPIVTYSQVQNELTDRKINWKNIEEGLREFTLGLAAKVLIANRIGGLWKQINTIGYESISTPLAWMGIFAFTFQIYFDFWGYSLMARGLGTLLGFHLPKNFQNPYISKSVTEFWRRWHITLGSWFKKYVYIPLGGNRSHHIRNLLIVWLLTGLWHGASWNYLLWAMLSFVCILIEKKGLLKVLDKHPFLSYAHMYLLVPLLWTVFAITDFGNLGIYFSRLFPFFSAENGPVFRGDYLKYLKLYRDPFVLSLVFSTALPAKIYRKKKYTWWMAVLLLCIFWMCIHYIYKGLDDPFLYYQF